jgi:phosphoribosylaminoimidazole carboxylase
MVNLLGTTSGDEGMDIILRPCKVAMGLPGASVHLYGKAQCRAGRKMGHITIVADTVPELLEQVKEILKVMPGGVESAGKAVEEAKPVVGIIMGSDSDLPTLKPAAKILKDFGVPFELTIVSAHRTPERMVDYAKRAHERGIQVIIAAAGGAAHLPGMVAALTPLPVIGVPVALRQLDGVDSLYSIVQMPVSFHS